MKKLYIIAFAFLSLAAYSQVNIPASSSRGTILTQTDQKIEYSNLKYEKGKVVYTNIHNWQQEFLYDNSIKSVEEKSNVTSSPEIKSENSTSSVALENPKLTDKREIKRFLLQENNLQYKSGKSLNNTGTAFLIGGAVCFLVGGTLNLSAANEVNTTGKEVNGHGPIPLVVGLIGMVAGVVMKLAGHSQMKKSVENYQNSDVRKFTPSYYVLNNQNGVWLMMKF